MSYARHMIRTQVYLTEQQYQQIRILAARGKKPAAEVTRELVDSGLKEQKMGSIGEALGELAKLGRELKLKGPKDLSKNIDKYLYEED